MLHDSIRHFLSSSSSSSSAILVRGILPLLLSKLVDCPEKLTVAAAVRWSSKVATNQKLLAIGNKPEEEMAIVLFGSGLDGTDEDEEMRRERRRRRRQKVSNCCKQMAAFLFSHIGLAAMVVAYSIMGGFMFRAIEAPAESRVKLEIVQAREEKIEGIWKLAVELQYRSYGSLLENTNGSSKDNFTSSVRLIMIDFKDEVVDAVKSMGWDGQEDMDETKLQWSFAGALLYAVTVITTIGYGHVAPKTEWGRILTMIYALIGIPLTFLYLSNIGNFMANCFRMFYKRVCCDILCCEKCDRDRRRERLKQRRQRELAVQRNILLGLHPGILGYNGVDESTTDHVTSPETPTTATTFIPEPTYETFDKNSTTAIIFTTNVDGNNSQTANTQCSADRGCHRITSDLRKPDSGASVALTNIDDSSTVLIPYTSQSSLKSTGSRQSSLSTLPVCSRRSSVSSVRETAILDDDNLNSHRSSIEGLPESDSVKQCQNVADNASFLLMPPPACSSLGRCGSNRSSRFHFRFDNLENQRETDILCESSVGGGSSTDGEQIPTPQTIRRSKPGTVNAPILGKHGIMVQLQQQRNCQPLPKMLIADSDEDSTRYDSISHTVEHPSARRVKSYPLRHVTRDRRSTVVSLTGGPEVTSSSPAVVRSSLQRSLQMNRSNRKSLYGEDADFSEVDGGVTVQPRLGNHHSKLQPDVGRVSRSSPRHQRTTSAERGHERCRVLSSSQRSNLSNSRRPVLPTMSSGISGTDGVDRRLRARSNWAKLRNHYRQPQEQDNHPQKRPPRNSSASGSFSRRSSTTKSSLTFAARKRISINEGSLSPARTNTSAIEDDCLQFSSLSADISNSGHHSVSFHDTQPNSEFNIVQHHKPTKTTADRTRSAPPGIFINTHTGRRLEMTSSLRDRARNNGRRGESGGGFDDDTFVDSTSTLCDYNVTRKASSRTGSSQETVKIRPEGDVDDDALGCGFNPSMADFEDEMERRTYGGGRDYDPFEYEHISTEHEGKVTVPIAICLIIIAGYIFAGAVLFTLWEDWDYLTGSYFCFITLSTIGFGDIVPGTDMDKWASHEKLILCALWLAFGLSLLAMCFNLMQEEVKEKCKWIGLRLGLLRDDEQQ